MKKLTLQTIFLAITTMVISLPSFASQNSFDLDDMEVKEPAPLTTEISFEPVACIGAKTNVSFKGVGGKSPYTLYDNDGEAIITFNNNYTLENLTLGIYNWSLADANSSEVAVIFELTVSESASDFLVGFLPETIATAGGKTTALVMASGGKAPYYLTLSEGNTVEFTFEHIVNNLSEGSYNWIVTDSNGNIQVSLDFEITAPIKPTILSNDLIGANKTSITAYPNPFRSEATLEYTLEKNADATVEIYNLAGERIALMHQGFVHANESRSIIFNANSLPNGIYIYRLTAGDKLYNQKITLSR